MVLKLLIDAVRRLESFKFTLGGVNNLKSYISVLEYRAKRNLASE